MALFTEKNEYVGLNAHLMGYLMDRPELWEGFHTEHMAQMQRVINAKLPQKYYSRIVKSIQTGELALYQEMLMSVVIFSIGARMGAEETPILRIELMSAASKQPGSAYTKYTHRRRHLLENGTGLLEIDYLHHIRPIISSVPSYALGFPDTKPYHMILTDPRPSLQDGKVSIFSWGLDEPIPTIDLMLNDNVAIPFELGASYDCTFNESTLYRLLVDYAAVPEAFDSFTTDDQKRIKARMEQIMAARKNGKPGPESA